ncbi:hypothetical protein [Cupriavidus sp. SK-3]|uniref:hypothetical protein n=1 Tax=Cupriavidus sp. SK-3 TaxID=1470558 RepID=UPI000AC7DD43|nr:hypothetical protein [Cupriavidus sp. SK-3]
MAKTVSTPVQKLRLDLRNYRTIAQADEVAAVQAMISVSPDRFWALTESLLDDGYLPTENVIVLDESSTLVVKEGNRRVGAMKLLHGYLKLSDFTIPDELRGKMENISNDWKTANLEVPCSIYSKAESAVVDRIVTLTHGKGEKAGRDGWNTVARARHNRDASGTQEPGLDLLEKYLVIGQNLNKNQSKRWSGDFPLSVLDEFIKKYSSRFGAVNSPDLARIYPAVQNRSALEDIVRDIGYELIGFKELRSASDLAGKYGASPLNQPGSGVAAGANPPPATPGGGPTNAPNNSPGSGAAAGAAGGVGPGGQAQPNQPSPSPASAGPQASPAGATPKPPAAVGVADPRAVMRLLKQMKPAGHNRNKVVALRDEARRLKLDKNPIAFCFLLRSMFEISAKAYCDDHKSSGGPSTKKSNGDDKALAQLLRDIAGHLTQNNSDKAMVKVLHGAMAELGRSDGFLSVTSMNQLVHNPSFMISPADIALLFGNIFPLLEAMNS